MNNEFYDRLKNCRNCREHPQIGRLSEAEFGLHWLYPHEWGDPSVPIQHVLTAMEPTLRGDPPTGEPRFTNSLNEPLNFAMRAFLGSRRYRMTNMAKCSMAPDNGSSTLCGHTRAFRINQCKGFLQEELEDSCNGGPRPILITVGRDPAQYKALRSLGYQPRQITHYSPRNLYRIFRPFAQSRPDDFKLFCEGVRPDYENWLWSEALASQFVNPGDKKYLEQLRKDIVTRPLPVLYRLFKWEDEMWEIAGQRPYLPPSQWTGKYLSIDAVK